MLDCETSNYNVVPQGPIQNNTTSHSDHIIECEPSSAASAIHGESCSEVDELVSVTTTLTALALANGFAIHGDGNCLFNAIAYQLKSINATEMRESVANHLESNSVFYRDFLAIPVICRNAYNADTEVPDDEDALIDAIIDPELQVQLRFQRYVHRLHHSAWGDHIAIQAISNHFNVAINVMSSQMVRIVPWNGTVDHKVYIGLILKYHFVGLDKLAGSDIVECDSQLTTSEPNDASDPFSNDVIAEGDEHIRLITSVPQASMMSLEKPEAFGQIVSIAPA